MTDADPPTEAPSLSSPNVAGQAEAVPRHGSAPVPSADEKRETYRQLLTEADSVLEGIEDPLTLLATVVALLHQRLGWSSWTGIYRVVEPALLRVGPYQGPVACLEIAFGKGVCGTAAAERATQVVPDVREFPGHIACDAGARSEIVVPLDDAEGRLYGVLDLDSHRPGAFDQIDREALEALVERLSSRLRAA